MRRLIGKLFLAGAAHHISPAMTRRAPRRFEASKGINNLLGLSTILLDLDRNKKARGG